MEVIISLKYIGGIYLREDFYIRNLGTLILKEGGDIFTPREF